MRALSIRQPWAWLIVNGHKDIENRDWATQFRGPVLIHASKTASKKYVREVSDQVLQQFGIQVPELDALPRGGVVGQAVITDCVASHTSPWFIPGGHGFVLAQVQQLPLYPCKGALGFFHVACDKAGLQVGFGVDGGRDDH